MLRVVVCLALLVTGCAVDTPATIVRTKIVKEYIKEPGSGTRVVYCPTEDQIRSAAVEASRRTYFKAPRIHRSGSGACPCRGDTYTTRDGEKHVCGEKSAEAKRAWVMCHREQVPNDLVGKIMAGLPA